MMKHATDLSATDIVKQSLNIAADICIYTNNELTLMEIDAVD